VENGSWRKLDCASGASAHSAPQCGFKEIKKALSTLDAEVILLNIAEYGVRQKEIEAAMAPMTEPAAKTFQEIWVLWKLGLYRLWQNGELDTHIVTLTLTY